MGVDHLEPWVVVLYWLCASADALSTMITGRKAGVIAQVYLYKVHEKVQVLAVLE